MGVAALRLLVAVAAFTAALAAVARPADGDLDPTYGSVGVSFVGIPGGMAACPYAAIPTERS